MRYRADLGIDRPPSRPKSPQLWLKNHYSWPLSTSGAWEATHTSQRRSRPGWLHFLPPPPPPSPSIQEHHLGEEGIQHIAKGIEYWQGSSFWNEGIPMGTSQRTSADTTILVDKATTPLIKEHDIVMEGRAQFFTLQSPNNGSLTIINIYVPPTTKLSFGESSRKPISPPTTSSSEVTSIT